MEEQKLYKIKNTLIDLFKTDGRWVRISGRKGQCVVLSDLHNDVETLNLIVDKYFTNAEDVKLVICGDYVDRSPSSCLMKPGSTLDYLFKLKLKYPDRVFMLMGNHELNPSKYTRLMPCEFWYSLSEQDEKFYTEVLESLPVVASTENGAIMTHGVLPSSPAVFNYGDLIGIELMEALWSDYTEDLSMNQASIRKQKGVDDFRRSMEAFNGNLLIKGHNPYLPLKMFKNKCVTLHTTRVYDNLCGRYVAIVDLGQTVDNTDDIELIDLSVA